LRLEKNQSAAQSMRELSELRLTPQNMEFYPKNNRLFNKTDGALETHCRIGGNINILYYLLA
jgi:hypothetical protein